MHNLRLDRLDGRSIQQNFLVTGQHMDSEHYIRWTYPRGVQLEDTAKIVGSSLREFWVALPDTGTPAIDWKFGRPEQWKLGRVETILYYSNSTNSTANISTTLRGYVEKVGTNTTTMAATLTQNGTFAGQATAGLRGSFTYAGYLPVTPETIVLSWSILRNVADANTGDLRILEVRQRYIPDKHEV